MSCFRRAACCKMISKESQRVNLDRMKKSLYISVAIIALLLPFFAAAQTGGNDMPLGDLARSLRKNRGLPAHTVIDNDNISKGMEEGESRKQNASYQGYSIEQRGYALTV